ncbi:MAG: hypothetical protein HGA85_01755 [Nanoarchaeota archaeon]|nr:hypothetical protein [Nanoarchaeota archaeon]
MVVQIGNDFNVDMDIYLKDRKKETAVEESKKAPEEFSAEEKEYYSEKKPIFKKVLDFIDKEEEEDQDKEEKEEEKELDSYQKPKKGFFSSIKGWLTGGEEEGDSNNSDAPAGKNKSQTIQEDVKAVLKIQNKWLLKLPPEEIREFKNSEDYKVYKDTLKKYNLIK